MPVAFSLMAGVLIGAAFTDVTFAAIIQKMFDGMDSEALLAIPFFLLVGELMSSANVVQPMTNLSLALVGHIKRRAAQVVTVFSMFFSEMSGSTTADVAVHQPRAGRPDEDGRATSRAFIAAIIAAASTIAALVPPSASPRSSTARSATSPSPASSWRGIVPGFMIGFGLMIYCYFFGPGRHRRPRAPFGRVHRRRSRRVPAADDPGHPAGRHPHRLVHAHRGRRRRGRVWIIFVVIPR